MNARWIAFAGDAARIAGTVRVSGAFTAPDNVRVALMHSVPAGDLPRFAHIVRLLTRSRRPITPRELFRHYESGERRPLSGRSAVFTFDDGLLSSYRATRAVLDPLGIKAMFFVPTAVLELTNADEMREFAWDRIHKRRRPIESLEPSDYLTMTRKEIVELDRACHAIYPHTHLHTMLSELRTSEDVERELVEPRAILEALLQKPADAFAFPIGTDRVVDAYAYYRVGEIYSFCFTALAGANTDATHPLLLHRDSIHPWQSLRHVSNVFDGAYDPYYKLRTRRLRRRVAIPSTHVSSTARESSASADRARFVTEVARALRTADVEFAFLHEHAGSGKDTDVDIAVDGEGLEVVDALARVGAFGELVQSFEYGAPRCRYYVLRSSEPGRRYRQLDVVCDPRGIGKDGIAVPLALASADETIGGLRVPSSAAETVYLAVKKARKRQWSSHDRSILRRSFERDPHGSTDLLAEHFGAAGAVLARALGSRSAEIVDELELVRAELSRQRRAPAALVRRALLEARRTIERVVRPTGLVVSIVGPDGAGKSTLARGLAKECRGAFRRTRTLHLRPGLLPPPSSMLGRGQSDPAEPHAQAPSGVVGSLARLGYLWLDGALGWWPKVWLLRLRSGLVLIERGWLDLSVDPLRYRLALPHRLVRACASLLPKPDLILVADAPADTVVDRKAELSLAEVARQLAAWRALAAAAPERIRVVDTSGGEEATIRAAAAVVDEALSSRRRNLASCELALRCLGRIRVGGHRYTVISAPRRPEPRAPRWLLPTGRGAVGPMGAALYRPARPRHYLGALALEVAQRTGLGLIGTQVELDPERGVAPRIAEVLGLKRVTLAASSTGDSWRGARALLSVWSDGDVVAFAKVAREERHKLAHEARVLDALGRLELTTLCVPEALGLFDWEDVSVLLIKPIRIRGPADRDLGPAELAGLAELAQAKASLADVLGAGGGGLVPVHGDFAPWNCAPRRGGKLELWDWEAARLGLPFEDYFHWLTQRLLRFGHGSVSDLVGAAVSPDDDLLELCELLEIDRELAPAALRSCLEAAAGRGASLSLELCARTELAAEGVPA
jgi:peptidoglycan/xylan/chitin deacetylase (PgdA/CDA1 family)